MLRRGIASLFAIAMIIPTEAADLSASREVEFSMTAILIAVLIFGFVAGVWNERDCSKENPSQKCIDDSLIL